MQTSDMIFIILGAINILGGLASIFTGKVYMMGSAASRYTDESLKKYARPHGITYVLFGIGLVCSELLKEQKFNIGSLEVPVGLAVLVIAIILGLVVYLATKKILVKK